MIPENKPLRLFDDADLQHIARASISQSDIVVSTRHDPIQHGNSQYEVQRQSSAAVKNESDSNYGQRENFQLDMTRATRTAETLHDDANLDIHLESSDANISTRKETPRVTPRTVDANIDNKLLDALLNVKERKNVLMLEQEIHAFVLSPAKTLTFSPKTNTYRRMLIHQIAERYGLNRTTLSGAEGKPCLVLTKSSDVRVPKPLLSEIEVVQDLQRDSSKAAMHFGIEPNVSADPFDHPLLHLNSLSTKGAYDAIMWGQQQPQSNGSVQGVISQQQSQQYSQQHQHNQQLQQHQYQQPHRQDRLDRSPQLSLPPHNLNRESQQHSSVLGPQIPRQVDPYGQLHGQLGTQSQVPRYDQSVTGQGRAAVRVPPQDPLDHTLEHSYETHGYRMTQSVPESSGPGAGIRSAVTQSMQMHLGNFANQFNPGHAYAYGNSSGYSESGHTDDAHTQFQYHQHQ